MKFTIVIDTSRCKGCALCVAVCSKKVLAMTKKLNARGDHHAETKNGGDCIGCLQCAIICPDAAIEVQKEDA